MTTATATATHEHITREQALSEQELVRRNLARFANGLTNNGETIAQFLHDTVQGEYPDAKHHHRQQAAINLAVMTGQLPENSPGSKIRVAPAADADVAPKPKKPKITMKEIVNWEIGRSIRRQTDDCRYLVLKLDGFLDPPNVFPSSYPPEKRYQKATRIRPHHQVSAALEMLNRFYGSQNPHGYALTSAREERRLQAALTRDLSEIATDGISLVSFLLEVIRNPKEDGWGEIIEDPYTQTQRLISIKHLLWRALDIPWDHITAEDVDEYLRDLDEKNRQEAERRRAERKAAAQLTPEQEAEVLALFEQTQRESEEKAAKDAARAKKRAKKAAKKAAADKSAELNGNNAANGNSAGKDTGDTADSASDNKSAANGDNAAGDAKNTDTPAATDTGADASDNIDPATLTPDARAARALARAIARHPNVDLDTALENHHATAGVPKENLTHEQIYDAITAEANFQKRQAIIQSRMRSHDPDAPGDSDDPPNNRSP